MLGGQPFTEFNNYNSESFSKCNCLGFCIICITVKFARISVIDSSTLESPDVKKVSWVCWTKNKVVVTSFWICWSGFFADIEWKPKEKNTTMALRVGFWNRKWIKSWNFRGKQFSNHLWIRFVEHWVAFVVVLLFWQGDMNLSEEISWFLSRKSV